MVHWFVICRLTGKYWTGSGDEFTTDLASARLFNKEEMGNYFCFKNEFWYPLHTRGEA